MRENIQNIIQDSCTFLQKWLKSEVDSGNGISLTIQFSYDSLTLWIILQCCLQQNYAEWNNRMTNEHDGIWDDVAMV